MSLLWLPMLIRKPSIVTIGGTCRFPLLQFAAPGGAGAHRSNKCRSIPEAAADPTGAFSAISESASLSIGLSTVAQGFSPASARPFTGLKACATVRSQA